MHYDVFNGDADGIIALLQLRLSEPKDSVLVTGVKRDIHLVSQVVEQGKQGDVSSVTVLDVSMEKNLPALKLLLEANIDVFYCDHHRTGDVPTSHYLNTLIDTAPESCTSLLINQKLNGAHVAWAIAATFGDNLKTVASRLADENGFNQSQTEFLEELGILVNYNGYGSSLSDLHFTPVDLYQALYQYPNPFSLLDDKDSVFYQLQAAYQNDRQQLSNFTPIYENEVARVFELPAETWARRISGVFGNEIVNQDPGRAQAVLTKNQDGESYTVSLRAPLSNRTGADDVCSSFETGGGRKAAAGINKLPESDKERFIEALTKYYRT
ncbi:DHH family phosphoesterase [Vibrio sp. 10N.261.46.E12]|uniref:DHH family phosphoesterase n=1 Tax=unclassified Vibrio TaxID=2614977 RepID=UPI000976FAE3|nr:MULTISPECIES: DHH family phosphoesterase [unclassified Vibrio]OMO32484.1 acetyltransferase [Vibrio sp. 10N.261.45.E1]PMJ21336.1 acetyltransferase [Vibrio sp. 10N.286.45.B6]PML84576.1 acetyltransferase [Vibrio sp. 10N.261.49.E11]PMM78881.1 acetyltransferase [Vibrio sp. 10N.261.46.E8]PMN27938.1 acetyltransferase [Vibrio sp. 10N.261.45.E2]